MSVQGSVLIIDASADSREVLRTALQRRGAQILEADVAQEGLELARQHRPDVIVLDLESNPVSDSAVREGFHATAKDRDTPIVILGTARRQAANLPTGQFVAKPYHYGPLIRRIEELLGKAA